MEIPQQYTISKINSYVSHITQNRNYINGSCPICHEGNSFGIKKRFYYFPNDDYMYCHKCGKSWTPYFWIKEVSGMTFKEIKDDILDYTGDNDFILSFDKKEEKGYIIPDLPGECVNLKDELQLKYYNNSFIVKIAKQYCEKRRLFTASFAPKTFYICIDDYFNKNRLVIPYFNELGKIESYITRQLLDTDKKAKYLLKFNSDKLLFNLNKIDNNYPYIFIFEGAIDAMFLKNGIAISGIDLTEQQEYQLNTTFPFHKRIWILDNYRMEAEQVKNKIIEKLKKEDTLFLYDGEFSTFKDLNDYCTQKKLDQVDPVLILNSCYSGQKGLLKL